MKQTPLPGELFAILDQSALAYQRYLQNGKTFYLAKELKHFNSKALKLLTDTKHLFPEHAQEDIESLITHYHEWSEKWDKLAAERNYLPDEVFAFENDTRFPRKAANNLENTFRNR